MSGTKKGGLKLDFANLLKNKPLIIGVPLAVVGLILFLLFGGLLKPPTVDEGAKKTGPGLAENLIASRWVGKMDVISIEGSSETYKTSNTYSVYLDIEFSQRENRNDLINLDFAGTAEISYTKPKVETYMPGISSVDIDLERAGAVADISGKLSGTNNPEQYNQAAFMQFWPESTKSLATPVTVTTRYTHGLPPTIDSFTVDHYCGFASLFCELWQLKNIAFMPDGEDRIKLTLKESLDPDYTEPSSIVGYLEKVLVRELDYALKDGQEIETKTKETLRARLGLGDSSSESELVISPNTSMKLEESEGEAILELLRGQVFPKIRNLPAEYKFKVSTPAAIVAVRGTDFSVNVLDEKTTIIMVYDGEVSVTLKETGKEITIQKGQYLISSDKDPKAHDSNIKNTPNWW